MIEDSGKAATMAGRLQDKVAVITGGGSGMGRATVLRFLDEGARVMVADINEANGRETVAIAKAGGAGDRVDFVKVDVTSEAEVAAMVVATESSLGPLDIAYLNAGVGGAFGPIAETSVADWDYTFAVLTRSVFLGMKHASIAMRKHGRGGAILSTASIAGMVGGAGSHAYSAAKAAVISVTENVAVELAPYKIRVNAIAPGIISTPLLHRGRPERYEAQFARTPWPERGEGEHIAAAAVFLCSDDARFVTGETMRVDGGILAQGIAVWGAGKDNPFLRTAGVNHGSTGTPMTVRTLDPPA